MHSQNQSCAFSMTSGSFPWRMVYSFFKSLITRSIWMRTFDSGFDSSTSFKLSCLLPFLNAGISSLAPWRERSFLIVKPRSAKTTPGFKRSRRPLFFVIHLLGALPPQHFDRKQIATHGVTAIKNLIVLCFL